MRDHLRDNNLSEDWNGMGCWQACGAPPSWEGREARAGRPAQQQVPGARARRKVSSGQQEATSAVKHAPTQSWLSKREVSSG